ncbi:hypothetical protein ACHZ98_17325 [Streptomyces sp. MAR4 CNY-716]
MYVYSSSVIAISAAALLAALTPVAGAAASAAAIPQAEQATRAERAAQAGGRTQSLPLAPLDSSSRGPRAGATGLSRPDVEPFTMVGVVWQDPAAELHARVQVRARSAETGQWSGWQSLDAHGADAPGPGPGAGAAEGGPAARRGGTAPLWVGGSTGVDVRVVPAGSRSAGPAVLFGKNPESKQTKVARGGKYGSGTKVRLNVISGHRDGFATECPGARLYDRLGAARASSASYQGRR